MDNKRNEKDPLLKFKKVPFPFIYELVVYECHITIEDIADVTCQFSNNTFLLKNFDKLDFLEPYFKKEPDAFAKRSIRRFDLRYCNFSKEEIDILKSKVECCGCYNC